MQICLYMDNVYKRLSRSLSYGFVYMCFIHVYLSIDFSLSYICVDIWICVHICIDVDVESTRIPLYIYTDIYTYIYTCITISACRYIDVHAYLCTRMHVYMDTY